MTTLRLLPSYLGTSTYQLLLVETHGDILHQIQPLNGSQQPIGGRDDTVQPPMCITNIRAHARCTLSFKAVSHSNPKKILRVYRDLNPRAFILPLVPILDEFPLTLHKLWCHTLKTSGPRNSTIKAEASNLQCFIGC